MCRFIAWSNRGTPKQQSISTQPPYSLEFRSGLISNVVGLESLVATILVGWDLSLWVGGLESVLHLISQLLSSSNKWSNSSLNSVAFSSLRLPLDGIGSCRLEVAIPVGWKIRDYSIDWFTVTSHRNLYCNAPRILQDNIKKSRAHILIISLLYLW